MVYLINFKFVNRYWQHIYYTQYYTQLLYQCFKSRIFGKLWCAKRS